MPALLGPESASPKLGTSGLLVLRGGGASALGYVLRFAARLLVLLVAGRLFGATLFGAFTIAIAVVEAASIAGGLSTKWMLFKWLDADVKHGRPAAHALLDALLLVFLASGLAAAGIAAAVVAAPAGSIGASTRLAILYLLPAVALQALLEVFLAATRWTEVMRYDVVAKSLIQPLMAIAAIGVLYLLGWRAVGLAWGYIAATAAALAYAAVATRRRFGGLGLRRYRVRPRLLWRRLRGALPTTGSDLIDALYTRVDIYVVGILLGAHAAGIYGLARQVSMPIRQVRQAFDGMLVPLVSHTLAHGSVEQAGRALARSSRLILVLQLPVVLLLWAFGRPLLGLIGPGFVDGYAAMLCLAAAEMVQGAFGLGELLLVYARPRLMMLLSAAFVALGAAAAVVLQPLLGLTGIGLSVLVSYGTRALCRRAMLRGLFGLRLESALWSGPAVAVVAGVAVTAALWPISDLASVAFGLGAYVGALAIWLGRAGDRLVPDGFISKAERPGRRQTARRVTASRPSSSWASSIAARKSGTARLK
jgi:O-antigen/teichoic acid export membrane protein